MDAQKVKTPNFKMTGTNWPDACAKLAADIPHYANKQGLPNTMQIAAAAVLVGFATVTNENIPAVMQAIRERAIEQGYVTPISQPAELMSFDQDGDPLVVPNPDAQPAEEESPDRNDDAELVYVDPEQSSFNFYLITPLGANVQWTVRGTLTAEQINASFETLKLAVYVALANKCTLKQVGQQAAQVTSAPAPAPLPAPTAASAPAMPAPTNGKPPAPASSAKPVLTIAARKLEVTPRADGKVDAKFYAAGHNYPDIQKACTAEALADLLKETGEWTAGYFAAAASFDVSMAVDYTLSDKLNSKNNPYKDIQAVRPA